MGTATTMTTLNCANYTTKTKMETSCPTWLMRSPKKILLPSSPNWLTQKMKMVSSHTLHSSTDCAARHNLVTNQINLITKKKIRNKNQSKLSISKMSFRKVRQNFLFNLADYQKIEA